MLRVHVEVKETRVKKAFRRAPAVMSHNLSEALNKGILVIGRRSARNAPVDTGRLQSSILGGSFDRTGQSTGMFAQNTGVDFATPSKLTATLTPQVDYAIYVHEGTRYMRGRPFMERAAETEKSEVTGFMEKAVDKTWNSVTRGI